MKTKCPHCGSALDPTVKTFPVVEAMEHANAGRYVVPVTGVDGPIRAHGSGFYSSLSGFRYERQEAAEYWRRNQYEMFRFFKSEDEKV